MIDYYLSKEAGELSDGEVEWEQSYFGGVRKGKRGRSAGGNIAVFGYLKRQDQVSTLVVDDTKTNTLISVI